MAAEFSELGCPVEWMDEVAEWFRMWTTLPPGQAMLPGKNDPSGEIAGRMIHRYVNQVIQNPTRADKPVWGNGTFGRIMLQFTPFSWAFWANIVQPTVTRTARDMEAANQAMIAQGAGPVRHTAAVAQQFLKGVSGRLAGFVLLGFFGSLLMTIAREALTNHDDWDRRVREEGEEAQWEHMKQLALDRFGWQHPLLDKMEQSIVGRKYQTDVANTFLGPFGSAIAQDWQAVEDLIWHDTKSNANERRVAARAYQGLVGPTANWAITALNLGPFGLPIQWLAMWTVPKFDSWAADLIVGPYDKDTTKGSGLEATELKASDDDREATELEATELE
jgi:hypothetical protein